MRKNRSKTLFFGFTFIFVLILSDQKLEASIEYTYPNVDLEYKDTTEGMTMDELYDYLYKYSEARYYLHENNPIMPIYDMLSRLYAGEYSSSFYLYDKVGDTFIGKVRSFYSLPEWEKAPRPVDYKYTTFEFMVKPDMQVIVLEDTIEPAEEDYFVMIPTQKNYIRNGYKIREYICTQKDEKTGSILDVTFPCLAQEDDNEWEKWNEVNKQLRNIIASWFGELCREGRAKTVLSYRIMTLDKDIYSIRFEGIIKAAGKEKKTCMGITVSLGTQTTISYDSLIRSERGVPDFGYYLDERRVRRIEEDGGIAFEGSIEFLPLRMEKKEEKVTDKRGTEVGDISYTRPVLYEEIGTESKLNELFRKNEKEFFDAFKQRFEDVVLNIVDSVYSENPEIYTITYIQSRTFKKYYCRVDSEIIYNNNNILGIRYSYEWHTMKIDDKGSAEFYYDTESGEVISGEEWIEDFYDKVSAYSMDEY